MGLEGKFPPGFKSTNSPPSLFFYYYYYKSPLIKADRVYPGTFSLVGRAVDGNERWVGGIVTEMSLVSHLYPLVSGTGVGDGRVDPCLRACPGQRCQLGEEDREEDAASSRMIHWTVQVL